MGLINRFALIGAIISSLIISFVWLSTVNTAVSNPPHQQTDHCVRPDGADGCFSTIQAAVNSAVDNDTITIAAGTYTESVHITHTLIMTGGWQPPGWPLTKTVVRADGADCALSLDNVSGSLYNLTVTGAVSAGICGTSLLTYTMENVTARNNMGHGTAVAVSHTLTISQSIFNNNQQNGLILSCTFGTFNNQVNTLVFQSTASGNGLSGFTEDPLGDSGCNFHQIYQENTAIGNGESGFGYFYGGPCPTRPNEKLPGNLVEILTNIIKDNGTGISADCGTQLILQQNLVQNNGTGLNVFEAFVSSVNNLYSENLGNGLEIRAAYWTSINDTITNNSEGELVLFDDLFNFPEASPFQSVCDTPHVSLTNSIIWDTHPGIEWYYRSDCPPYPVPFYLEIDHSIVSGRDLLVTQPNLIYFEFGAAVYDTNPFFIGNGNYQLTPPSPAIDTGTSGGAPLIDIDGQIRPQDGDGDGIPDFDMGAYEAPPDIFWRAYSPTFRK